jgi:hypothetical protein
MDGREHNDMTDEVARIIQTLRERIADRRSQNKYQPEYSRVWEIDVPIAWLEQVIAAAERSQTR